MFTSRENEVMKLIIKGLSNPEISKTLGISNHTTKAHLLSIYKKLKVSNRVSAVIKYLFSQENYMDIIKEIME